MDESITLLLENAELENRLLQDCLVNEGNAFRNMANGLAEMLRRLYNKILEIIDKIVIRLSGVKKAEKTWKNLDNIKVGEITVDKNFANFSCQQVFSHITKVNKFISESSSSLGNYSEGRASIMNKIADELNLNITVEDAGQFKEALIKSWRGTSKLNDNSANPKLTQEMKSRFADSVKKIDEYFDKLRTMKKNINAMYKAALSNTKKELEIRGEKDGHETTKTQKHKADLIKDLFEATLIVISVAHSELIKYYSYLGKIVSKSEKFNKQNVKDELKKQSEER